MKNNHNCKIFYKENRPMAATILFAEFSDPGLCWPPPKFTKESWIVTRNLRKKFWEKAVDIDELCGPGEAWFVESVLDVYWELPPVAGPSLNHQMRYDPARASSPIVEDGRYGLFRRLGLAGPEASVINGYTQMVYLQVSKE
ncbi:hypothetical protein H5410_035681 [Solanum commersonii]|uniref:Uncharacterized protein n=1 Tax=Solanum commersonii TaxID=4109 RepID=A0A9J5Y1Z2_SOLCO|nr:hypothetical protein H5410_035681 [Solanum commersonii]